MLLDFSVKNFGPFRDTALLTMQATSNGEHPENTFESEAAKGRVLSSAIIFGPNSSGKSYIIKAVHALCEVVKAPLIEGERIPQYIPFRLSRESEKSPTEMGIRLIIDDILYDYSISFDSYRIVRESLFYYPNGRRSRVFVRDAVKGNEGIVKDIFVRTTPNSAYLTVSSTYNEETCRKVWRELQSIIILSKDMGQLLVPSFELLEADPELRMKMLRGLSVADFGIEDFKGDLETLNLADFNYRPPAGMYPGMPSVDGKMGVKRLTLLLKHGFDGCDCDEQRLYFPMNIESEGTMQMFGIMGPVVDALTRGLTVFIDEFGSLLHPSINRWLVGLFSSEENTGRGQLIANTHDISLMDIQDVFRRDQIYFTNKDRRNGSAELYSLSDFKGVRKDTDVMKAYLFGRFDAIPNVFTRKVI